MPDPLRIPVITNVQTNLPRFTLEKIPFPAGATFTVDAMALMFRVTRRTMYNLLSSRRHLFDPPMYRKRRDRRLERLLTERDFATLRAMYPVYVRRPAPDPASRQVPK